MNTIADFPAYRIYEPYEGRKFRHGEVIAIPFVSRSHGTLYHFYTLGTVAGYAVERGDDPEECLATARERGHKLHWANANAVTIHNGPKVKKEVPGFNIGDPIILQGRTFRIEKAPNDNINLVPVE